MAGDEQQIIKPHCSVLVGACSCQRYPGRRDACRETWMQHPAPGVMCKFFLGSDVPLQNEPDVVTLPVSDRYRQLPIKVFSFYEWAVHNVDFDWLMKVDDDTYCAIDKIYDILDSRFDMIGDNAYTSTRGLPSGGAGYVMSRRLVEHIVLNKERVPINGAEDCVFGSITKSLGYKIKPDWRLHARRRPWPTSKNEHVTCHYVNPYLMKQIEDQYYGE